MFVKKLKLSTGMARELNMVHEPRPASSSDSKFDNDAANDVVPDVNSFKSLEQIRSTQIELQNRTVLEPFSKGSIIGSIGWDPFPHGTVYDILSLHVSFLSCRRMDEKEVTMSSTLRQCSQCHRVSSNGFLVTATKGKPNGLFSRRTHFHERIMSVSVGTVM